MLKIRLEQIYKHCTEQQKSWLNKALQTLDSTEDVENDILNLSVVVKRKFGEGVCPLEGFSHFNLAEFIRLLLLNQCQNMPIALLAKHYYQFGDETEKCALLKGLPYIDECGSAVQTAIKACRCNSLVEFSAIALSNPYPAQFFPELNFNQLVLKSLFMGLEISQIHSIEQRLNAKLSNMCFAYAVEQALAERNLPASVWLAVTLDELDEDNRKQFEQYAKHYYQLDEAHRQQLDNLISQQSLSLQLS
ncbi:hypothetical protein C2869_13640 [Saccharobesus litoralis]|uniref:Uncharacterized protein n=1 Tax=Saccharobesus litoralis TaxID=2172099 RepID=A0A2S0VT85_9ALTE|nr:EboA domain-containing protein [Saccharobesus litoralis]AWB67417.1 hypothetical protein C2869_13640 [Saccharobesus litoralis]